MRFGAAEIAGRDRRNACCAESGTVQKRAPVRRLRLSRLLRNR